MEALKNKFVEKAVKAHGNCRQRSMNHIAGNVCGNLPKSKSNTYTTGKFVEKAIKVHGDKYAYSKSVYVNAHSKIEITCPLHGDFCQVANDHLSGCGCPKCGYKVVGGKRTLTQEKFFKKAIEIYGEDRYDYTKTVYLNALTDVVVTCKIHGDFKQNAHSFLQGHGCQRCGYAPFTLSDCLNKFKEIHGDIYDYSKIDYYNCTTKVCIICKDHGEFWKMPRNHIEGQGCPHCHISYGERIIKSWLSDNNIRFIQQYKFKELKIGKRFLQFDFYLPDINTLIEYDGEQHYRPVRFNGISIDRAVANFKKSQHRDSLKDKFCENKKVTLIRISYNQNKELPSILSKITTIT
jgi:very-short-patch-repair endonuclease